MGSYQYMSDEQQQPEEEEAMPAWQREYMETMNRRANLRKLIIDCSS